MVSVLAPSLTLGSLLAGGLATSLPNCGPWEVACLGPDSGRTVAVHEALVPWLGRIPYARAMSRQVLAFPSTRPDRSFPTPLAMLWPADLEWRPLLNPWDDPGAGVMLLELVGDHEALLAQLVPTIHRLYQGLVLEPMPVSGLLAECCEAIGGANDWPTAQVRALAQDSRALQQHRELLAIYLQRESSEVAEGDDAGEYVGRPRMLLALHAGSATLPTVLLPALHPDWAEAVLEPRELSADDIAAFPRTIVSERYLPYLQWCGRLGAIRRLNLQERIAELLHQEAWEVRLVDDPLLDQALVGQHRFGGELLLRWGWQMPSLTGEGFMGSGIGADAWRWRWSAECLAALNTPLIGLPFCAPRLLSPRDALRSLEDWPLIEDLRVQRIALRAGSKGLLRSHHPSAFCDGSPLLEWARDMGLIGDLRRLEPLGYVLG